MKGLLIALAVMSFSGGAIAADAKTKTDDFDGTQHVWIDPHGMSCKWDELCYSVGADWNSKRPEVAVLVVQFMGAYTEVKAAALNIDGDIVPLSPPNGSTDYSQGIAFTPGTYSPALAQSGRTSTQGFDIPLSVVKRVLAAKTVKMRLIIEQGNIDTRMIDDGKPSKAFAALQRFMAKVPGIPTEKADTGGQP